MSSVLAIHGVCTVLWVGSLWDPKYLLLLTFTTLNVLSHRGRKSGLHKSRDFKNLHRPFPDFTRYYAYVSDFVVVQFAVGFGGT